MISIVIPTINHVDLVKQCATSIINSVTRTPFEIIVVDDGSPPPIQQQLKIFAEEVGIVFIPKPANEGFSCTVNIGISAARGEHVILVNNDIIFHMSGWLENMLEVLESDPTIGIVGARLLYPDQTIQHAGVFPANNRFFEHRFRGFPADYPPALAVENFHAVTGALMLINRKLIEEIGPFSEEYFIAFEDIDFCYRAKQQGWRIVYCGTATAIHLEGKTRGTRLSNKNRFWRAKELEARRKFWTKWQEV